MSGQRTQWNEATRVQMPALVHLTRIGFTYFGKITEDKAGTVYDPDTNILIEVFKSQFAKLNPERAGEAEAMLRIIRQELDNDDIGESFYKRLKAVSPVRLIDFEHPENNSPYFLYYWLSTKKEYLFSISSVTRTPILSKGVFEEIEIPSISRSEQDKIAKVLLVLDKKIKLNSEVNDNLAQQAQLLFDFMFQDISGSKHIGDFIVPQRGTALLSKDAIPGDIPVVAGGLVPSTYHNAANTVAPVITISSSGANAGFVNLWGVPVWSSDSSFIDFKMTPYVYFWHALLKRHQNNIYKIQTGSAQPHIYPSHIASLPVCDLDFGKVADYTERVTPLFTLISKNYKESNQLRALRDWLLPMLMNGQATISD